MTDLETDAAVAVEATVAYSAWSDPECRRWYHTDCWYEYAQDTRERCRILVNVGTRHRKLPRRGRCAWCGRRQRVTRQTAPLAPSE